MRTLKSPVLWVSYEENASERMTLCQHYINEAGLQLAPSHVLRPEPINSDLGIGNLREDILQTGAKLIVIDPLVAAVDCENLTESVASRKALTPLKQLADELGVTIILLHHFNKMAYGSASPNRMSDSHQIAANCHSVLELDLPHSKGWHSGHKT